MKVCYIIEQGWIIIGTVVPGQQEERIITKLTDASVVRSWSNGKGIGGIAKLESKDDYKLDFIGDVGIYGSKILFEIPCEW